MPCDGNADEFCGAGNRLDIFWSGSQPPPAPIMVPSVGNWSLLGCYRYVASANPIRKANPHSHQRNKSASLAIWYCRHWERVSRDVYHRMLQCWLFPGRHGILCGMLCACILIGRLFFADKFADCASTLGSGSGPTPSTDCDMVCAGNSSEYCGGPNRLSLYNYTQTLPTSLAVGSGGTGSIAPVTTGLQGNWSYAGCYVDNVNGRILGNELDSASTTVESCIANCASQNFTIAGIEYSTQCCE